MKRQTQGEISEAFNIQALEEKEIQDSFLSRDTEDYLVSAQAVVDMPAYSELEALHTLKKRADTSHGIGGGVFRVKDFSQEELNSFRF